MDSGCVRGMNWETGVGLCILPCVKQIATGKLPYSPRSSVRCSVMTGRGRIGVRGKEAHEGGDIGILIADSCRCTAETNTTL